MIEIFFDHAFEYAFGSLFRSRGAGYRLDMRAIGGAIDSTRKLRLARPNELIVNDNYFNQTVME